MKISRRALSSAAKERTDEQLRRVSARATKSIVRRFGKPLGMWIGCGYPKSGTVWLCNLLSSYLNIPHPRNYRMPVAMPSVVHAHWLPDRQFPRTVYVVRDGRDVMVSRYFHEVRLASSARNPRAARARRERFKHLFGGSADLNDIEANLPRFIEAEADSPSWVPVNWAVHVDAWLDSTSDQVAIVRYEDLLVSVEETLAPAIEKLSGVAVDLSYLHLAAERFAFSRQASLERILEQRGPFLRKGVTGDWKNHFSSEAEEVFMHFAGHTLKRLDYLTDE